MSTLTTTKDLFGKRSIQERFEKLLGDKTQGFITSVLQVVQTNYLLENADPASVLNAAATAAALDLPINPNLGFAWIVPYRGKAQFQMGWKGYVQLALRTGQYKNINVSVVYENQFKSFNSLTEDLEADFSKSGDGNVVGYAAHFRLINGFEKTCYWTIDSVKKHATKYSQTYNKKSKSGGIIYSPWNDEDQFDSMCLKTVLKNTLSKWGIMSIQMQTAHVADQSVQLEEGDFSYPDNTKEPSEPLNEKEIKVIKGNIAVCLTMSDVNDIYNSDIRIKTNKELTQMIRDRSEQLKSKES